MTRLRTLFALAALVLSGAAAGAPPLPVPLGEPAPPVYVCPPCPHVDDLFQTPTHDAPGTCPVCGMALVERPVRAALAPAIHDGSGAFRLRVGPDLGREVDVFYYRPAGLTARAPVLIVLPGAGRNAWE